MSPPRKPKVLIIDDSPESLHILVEALRDCCAPFVAKDGRRALELARRPPPPEAILLDVMMPESDGYEVFRQIRQIESCREIPVLFITALQDVEREQQALAMGAVDFLRKPIHPAVVRARLMTHVELARARFRLVEQNHRLEEAARMRDLVERILHHDLKGPLGVILGLPELMMTEDNLTPEQVEMLRLIRSGGNTMLEMINRSLDLYKMEEGVYAFEPVALDLRPVIERAAAEYLPLSRSKSCPILLSPQADAAPWRVPAEDLLCRSLFGNLLKNALESSPAGSPVTVALRRDGATVEVRLHNRGAVPLPIRERFFHKFATHGKPGGSGLGCYSAMLMARVQRAELTMQTSDEEGTSLIVRFPAWTDFP
ncbi:MAG: hybrid sensor histidine kinase/response regulator [Magnetococcales bacterium]|nr:hybrid sensor histidine kinase/response regulator [Magnetococcales bacterium]